MNQHKRAKGFFVTGTDTGVGKTILTVALLKLMKTFGLKVCGMKPVESGCVRENEELIPSDGEFIKTAGQLEEPLSTISPCRFEHPLAPLAASRLEGVLVDLEKIQTTYTHLSSQYDALIVEGVGGLLVPVTENYSVLDLAKDFGLPVIVVARTGLGTLNHTMLTVNYALKEGLTVAGVIMNESLPPANTLAERTNEEILMKISPVPLFGVFPYLNKLDGSTIEQAAEKHIDTKALRKLVMGSGLFS